MGTKTRPELSEKNKYWIDKHRFYELKHFCLQYPFWKKAYSAITPFSKINDSVIYPQMNYPSDPTAKCAIAREFYMERIQMIERTATETDPMIASYILKAVTEGLSYEYLKARLDIPCCKDIYYNLYRRFFWLLSKERK